MLAEDRAIYRSAIRGRIEGKMILKMLTLAVVFSAKIAGQLPVTTDYIDSNIYNIKNKIVLLDMIFNQDFPEDSASIDLTDRVCSKIQFRDLLKDDFQIPNTVKRVNHAHKDGNTYISFTRPIIRFFGEKTLLFVALGGDYNNCEAYLTRTFV